MTRIERTLVFLAAIPFLLAAASSTNGQPSISKENIPPQAPADVRAGIERLYSAHQGERAEAATRLGEKGSRAEAAVPYLIEMLGEADNVVPDERLEAERTFSPLDKLSRIGYKVADALGKIGPAAVDPLIDALEHGTPAVRSRAAYALGKIPGPRPSEALVRVLKDPEWGVRDNALSALADRRDPRSFEALLAGLGDDHWIVRRTAVDKLVGLRDPRAVDPIAAAFEREINKEAERRKKAGVDEFGSGEPGEARLETIHAHFLRSCLAALLEIQDPHAVETLLRALKLRMPVGERLMQRALERSRPPGGQETAAQPSDREALLAFFKAEEPVAKGILMNLFKVRKTYAVAPLLDALKDADPFIRMTAAGVLGGVRDSATVPSLIALLSDDSMMVRARAAGALAKIGDPAALDPLIQALGTENQAAQREIAGAVATLGGPEAVLRLEDAMRDPRPSVRSGASIALKLIRSGPATNPLAR